MNELDTIKSQVCAKIPQGIDFLTPQQCTTYIELYGPYAIDLLMENTKTSAVCNTLGLCQDSNEADKYQIILPTILSYMVEYDVKQTVISSNGLFQYKMFLGTPPFPETEYFYVEVFSGAGCSLNVELSNKSIEQPYYYKSKSGFISVMKPGRGVWYYLTVGADELQGNNTCSFSVKSTVQPLSYIPTYGSRSIIVISPIIFIVVALAALCCCCCAIRRRKCKSKCRAQQSVNNDLALDVKSVELAQMQTPTPVGYFYVPATGQYVQVPQIPQQMAYPEYYVVQQE